MVETNNNIREINWEEALKNESWIAPLTDMCENDEDYQLYIYMPGVSKKNIKIKVENSNLILMGKSEENNSLENYILKEFEIGNYYRKFQIASSVDVSKIEAEYENGILMLKLPKYERAKPKNIEIK